jgi:hypothetical protein
MGNYLFAYRGGGMAASEEEQQAAMAKWGAWFGQLGEALVDGGAPFAGSITVGNGGGAGPAPSGLTGYSVVKSDSLDAAAEMARGCPILETGGTVDVYEGMAM